MRRGEQETGAREIVLCPRKKKKEKSAPIVSITGVAR